ncbi:HugZ family protein [Pseudoalteromonas piscicida]|uniref:Pyridoxamine 5'-phosphate oxidase n=1 Tax=Pseudoalteromonas piscicida TaxID=43662 RepID=A0A2A5JUZ4_PSEO7|nr:pyridoxamine 5'-phosphate oxidase family protein [Pseudoalteromonas piscicida]PCK33176.1 pyridoxamine 5'-phosphate oxidase [Pseudoalteromonas piscicida]
MRETALSEARALCQRHKSAFLSTLSNNQKDFPFSSVAQYVLLDDSHFYFFMSDIAQHTKNLAKHPALSFMILGDGDIEDAENARVTILGHAHKLSREESHAQIEQFVATHEKAQQYAMLGDFHLWRVDVARVRYVGGFGRAFWIEKKEWYADNLSPD